MALFLKEKEVEQVLTMPLALEAVEQAMKDHAFGDAVNIPRERTRIPKGALHILQGALPGRGVLGYKAYTSTKEGNCFLLYLYDSVHGNLEAIIEADLIGMTRTGAAAGIAAKWLSRPESSVVGLFGTGWQARGQLEGLCAVRPIKKVKVLGRDWQRLKSFCEENSRRLGIEVLPAAEGRETVSGSDIVTTVTTSPRPVVCHPWVERGTHLNAVGSNALIRCEIDEKTLLQCDLIAVDSREVAVRECGDLLPLVEKGRINWHQTPELGEIIAGRVPGRRDPDQITLFESHGMAIQDLAVGALVLEKARAQGLGTELPIGC
ncbi:MAG: ornithine cyclodeaminase family protein [Syntrophotaleaceae bacterium]